MSTRQDDAPVFVTGGAGFIGSNLAARLARSGRRVVVVDSFTRPGSDANADWLTAEWRDRIEIVEGDIRDAALQSMIARDAAAVFHLAAQVAVTTSIDDPITDFEVNACATASLLARMRAARRGTPFVFASTNKVYGRLGDIELEATEDGYAPRDPRLRRAGVDETRPLAFATPYGCSKGAADQCVLDHALTFGEPACVLRLSCVYGPRQNGAEDQGWMAHFARRALDGEPIDVFGDGLQVRDVLFVDDAVDAFLAAQRMITFARGRAFNLGGGPANAVSLVRVARALSELADRPVAIRYAPWRAGDQRWYVSDVRTARNALGLLPFRSWQHGLRLLVAWLARAPSRVEVEPVA